VLKPIISEVRRTLWKKLHKIADLWKLL